MVFRIMTKVILLVQVVLQLFVQSSQPQDHSDVVQSIETTQKPDIISTKFDCSTYWTCTQCVTSQFPCHWYLKAHRCTKDTANNDMLVTSINYNGIGYRSGPGFCPRIDVTSSEGQEIMVSSGTKKQVKVKVHIIGQFMEQTRFVCQFNIEGRITSVNAELLGDVITCDELEFDYGAKTPNLTVTFAILWGGSKPLDNPNNIRVLIYSCKEMADSCGACLTLDEKYRCGWCSSSNRCEVEHQCGISGKVQGQEKEDWLNSQQTCPNTDIRKL